MPCFKRLKWFAAALVPVFLAAGCREKSKDPAASGPKAVMVAGIVVQPRELVSTIVATGSLIANEEVELRSEVPGRVVSIHFDEGTRVAKGALLMKTDDRELQAQLLKLQVEEKQARDDLYRKEKLLELKAVSQEEYDRAFNAHGIVRAGIDLVRAQISKTEIYAPFSGVVGLRQVSPGGFVSSSTPVARLQQTDPLKLEFAVPEKYRLKVHTGTRVGFRVEGIDSLFTGQIYAIEPKVDPSTRNITMRALCSNAAGLLVPGAFARVDIRLDQIPDALVIPSEAVIPVMSGEKVYVSRNGKAVSSPIETGLRTETEVEIVKGLMPGDTVITTGLLQLREETPVKIRLLK